MRRISAFSYAILARELFFYAEYLLEKTPSHYNDHELNKYVKIMIFFHKKVRS